MHSPKINTQYLTAHFPLKKKSRIDWIMVFKNYILVVTPYCVIYFSYKSIDTMLELKKNGDFSFRFKFKNGNLEVSQITWVNPDSFLLYNQQSYQINVPCLNTGYRTCSYNLSKSLFFLAQQV